MSPSRKQRIAGRTPRSTPEGQHLPVMLEQVLAALDPQPGETVVDCTLGFGGHAAALLGRVGSSGRLIGMDWDAENLERARARLTETGLPFFIHHSNFAGIESVLAAEGVAATDVLLADLGMSSMQVDDAERGFSYVREGPLDMRMDRSRGRTAAEVLASISVEELAQALRELGDEPHADQIAAALVARRARQPLLRTSDVTQAVAEVVRQPATREAGWRLHSKPGKWNLHPAARTFQALRILVNRELANLQHLLRVLPRALAPGGRAAIISFHSGEDRLVKAAFRDGLRAGIYAAISDEPLRATEDEKRANPRSRSAKLRWARRSTDAT